MQHPLFILAVLSMLIAASEWLVRRTALRHLGSALLVILLTAVVANLGLIPAGSTPENPVPVYDGIFAYLAPLAIFWLLLPVSLRDILDAGLPMIALFLIGSLATAVGVVVGMWVINAPEAIGPLYHAVGGMFVGTYTGGSVNFNALAINYDIMREGVLYGGSVAVDNIITTTWMVATLALPRLLAPLWRRRKIGASAAPRADVITGVEEDTEAVHPLDLGLVIGLGLLMVWFSEVLSEALAGVGVSLSPVIVLTALALLLAQIPAVARLRGVKVLGMYAVYLFLAVIGAFCDLGMLQASGRLGLMIFFFASIAVAIHGLITFAAAWLLRLDLDVAAVASQANVGGGTSALAIARSLGRADLVLPGILLGALGNAVGTFLGFWVAQQWLPALF